jgi:hypothetical protein
MTFPSLSKKEIKRLGVLGKHIILDLFCKTCNGIPCRTCRIEAVTNMKEYIKIQEGNRV